MPLLEAEGISKAFGKLTALDRAALTVEENEFHGLIGPNGSGKSTLMKCLAGAEVPTQGKISFANTDITTFTPADRARAALRQPQPAGSAEPPPESRAPRVRRSFPTAA